MSDPENGNVPVVKVRRRRTSRHRRNRMIRRGLAAAAILAFTIGASSLALRVFVPSLFSARQAIPAEELIRLNRHHTAPLDQILAHAQAPRPVYPYSVVPGGVEDAKELKWVAEHDPVVAAHYAGFDYAHAQVVRLTLARTVYVSYRIGNRIYWTSRRVTLKKGEKLITDGRMTARSRCANRVEETPQQEAASPVEPPAQKFDEPMIAGGGTAIQSPAVPFESALNRPQRPGLEAAMPLSLYDPFVGGSLFSFSAPPLPEGLCAPLKKKGEGAVEGEAAVGGKKKKVGPCGVGSGSGGTVPEPGTWILFASGLAGICWQVRRKFSQA